MTIKETIQAEIEKLDETDLEELYRLILEFVDQRRHTPKNCAWSYLSRVCRAAICSSQKIAPAAAG